MQRIFREKHIPGGEKTVKTLRSSKELRSRLLEDYKKYKIPNNKENRAWVKALKKEEQYIPITFDGKAFDKDGDVMLITISHPLVKQAAAFLETESKSVTAFRVETNRYQAGEDPFAVFQWKMSGEREDLQLKTISIETGLNDILLDLLKESKEEDYIIQWIILALVNMVRIIVQIK